MALEPRALRHRRARPKPIVMLTAIALCSALAWIYIAYYMPNMHMAAVLDAANARLVIAGAETGERPLVKPGGILLSVDTIRKHFDPNIFWDEEAQTVIITTENRLIKMKTDSLTAFVNRVAQELSLPASEEGGVVYVPMEILHALYGIEGRFVEESGTVFFDVLDAAKLIAHVTSKHAVLRVGPSKHEPIAARLTPGDELLVVEASEGWYAATSSEGFFGYVPQKALGDIEKVEPASKGPVSAGTQKVAKRINLTWEHVFSRNPDTASIPDMPGLNVISPTWFEVANEEGDIKNKACSEYASWAREKGYKIWALLDNGFDPERTNAVLRSAEKRESVAAQILAYAVIYQIDGINIDFENVYYEDRAFFTQFVRELSALLHEQGLTVSVDVTMKSKSRTWSMFYDRSALAEAVDYVMLMAYDEHSSGSKVAGSVASLPWAKAGLLGVLEEVPNEKLVLGVPFYTRIWREESEGGRRVVKSSAVGMEYAQARLKETRADVSYDPLSGQNYAVYEADGIRHQVWLEDETSLTARLGLIEEYGLAGIASWRRGFEKPEMWELIDRVLNPPN